MIEAIVGYIAMSRILKLLFLQLEVNKEVVEILFVGLVVVSILLMIFQKQRGIGTALLVGSVAAYVIVYELVPYASTVALWGGVIAALALVIMVKVMTYHALHRNTITLKGWQRLLIYLA